MSTIQEQQQAGRAEVDLLSLILMLWHGKLMVVGFVVFAAVASIIYALSSTPIYTAQTTLQLRSGDDDGGGIAGQLSGIADLAGLNLGNADFNRQMALEALTSRVVIQRMIAEENLLPILYPKLWDAEHKRWTVDDLNVVPTPWKAYKDFTSEVLKVSESKKTGIVTVAIQWKDPALAASWTKILVERVNAFVNDAAIREAEQNLKFLEEQARTTTTVELQKTIYAMMETEVKKLMIARNRETAPLRVIDPAMVPERRTKPRRSVIVILGTIFGGFFGVFAVLMRHVAADWQERLKAAR